MNRTSRACTPGGERGERATPGLHDLSKSPVGFLRTCLLVSLKFQKVLKTCHLRLTQMYPTCLSGWNTSFRPNTNFSDFRGRSSNGRSMSFCRAGTSSLREVGGSSPKHEERGVLGRRCPRMEPSLHLGLREQAARGSGELCLPLLFRVRGADCPRRQDPVGMTFPLVGLWAFGEARVEVEAL